MATGQALGRGGRPASATLSSFDTAEAVRFLDLIFGDVSTGLISISYITPAGRVSSKSFQWIRSAAGKAAEWDKQRPKGIYFRCTALPPQGVKGGRGGADGAHCLPFLWADLDYGDVGHKSGRNRLPLHQQKTMRGRSSPACRHQR